MHTHTYKHTHRLMHMLVLTKCSNVLAYPKSLNVLNEKA